MLVELSISISMLNADVISSPFVDAITHLFACRFICTHPYLRPYIAGLCIHWLTIHAAREALHQLDLPTLCFPHSLAHLVGGRDQLLGLYQNIVDTKCYVIRIEVMYVPWSTNVFQKSVYQTFSASLLLDVELTIRYQHPLVPFS